MYFEPYEFTWDTIYYNVVMRVTTKRSDYQKIFDNVQITGSNPLETVAVMRSSFHAIEKEILLNFLEYYNVVITIGWLDAQRRNLYERYLSRHGYRYGTIHNELRLIKKYKKGALNEND